MKRGPGAEFHSGRSERAPCMKRGPRAEFHSGRSERAPCMKRALVGPPFINKEKQVRPSIHISTFGYSKMKAVFGTGCPGATGNG
eukprot:5795483-Lingulodinium_polyedra.AAC.1